MILLTTCLTIVLFFGVFKILTTTAKEYRHTVYAVIERAELLDAIKAERMRSQNVARA